MKCGEISMIVEIFNKINKLSRPARYIIYIGIVSGIVLLVPALFLSLQSPRGVKDIYLSCNMSKTATTLFAEGIVGGLIYEFFVLKLKK